MCCGYVYNPSKIDHLPYPICVASIMLMTPQLSHMENVKHSMSLLIAYCVSFGVESFMGNMSKKFMTSRWIPFIFTWDVVQE
jgi:hypothetical protein